MKKWLFGFVILLILAVASIYIFIPSNLEISQVTAIRAAKGSTYRFLSDENNWRKWWPGDSPSGQNSFSYDNVNYTMLPKLRTTVDVKIGSEFGSANSTIDIIPLANDSLAIEWQCTMPSGMNPINKIKKYNEAVAVKQSMDAVLEHFRKFIENLQNVYGIDIQQTSTKDTLLICTKEKMNSYPTDEDAYRLLGNVKKFMAANQAKQTGFPMKNITVMDSGKYQIMVAIPVDKELQKKNEFFPSKLVPGRFLVAEVKGGPHTIVEAERQIKLYMQEYKRMALAIPFESMITDRSVEKDTTKWVTKLFNPVL